MNKDNMKKKTNTNYKSREEKEYKKKRSLEIQSNNIVSPNSQKLISDIAFFIDLENDFNHDEYHEILDKLLHDAYDLLVQDIEIHKGSMGVNLAVIGNFSSGKSSFINSLIGKELCPVKANPTTSSITRFIYSDKPKIVLLNDDSEITEDEYVNLVQHIDIEKMDQTKNYQIDYYYPFEEMRDITIYDTPGFNNPKNRQDEKVTMDHANQADVIFLVMDINNGDLDNTLLDKIRLIQENNSSTKWHLIVNKMDLKPPANREKILLNLQDKYADRFKTIIAYSSKNSDSKANFDQQLENIYKNIKERLEKEMLKKVPEVNFHLNMKKNLNSKIYDCHIDNRFIGEIEAEKDVNKLKKKQKQEILSILKDIGSNKYNFLSSKLDAEFNLYEINVKKTLRDILENSNGNEENKLFMKDMNRALKNLRSTLKRKSVIRFFFDQIITDVTSVQVPQKEKSYWSSPWWKWKINDRQNTKYVDIRNINMKIIGLFHHLDMLLNKYSLNLNAYSLTINIENFLRDILWEHILYLLKCKDREYFDDRSDGDLYKKTIYEDFDIDKELDSVENAFFVSVDRDIDSIKKILLKEISHLSDNKKKEKEIYNKINIYLGEEDAR